MIFATLDYAGLAALITAAVTGVATLAGVARAQGKAREARTEARHEAEKVDIKVTNEINRRARNEGTLDRLSDTVSSMQQQIIDTIQSTADQREKVTQLLVDCEKRHTEKDTMIHDLRDEVQTLAGEVAQIKATVTR